MKQETTLAGIPRLDPPKPLRCVCGHMQGEHGYISGHGCAQCDCRRFKDESIEPRYIAKYHTVKFCNVTICRAPSNEKAKKLARMMNSWDELRAAIQTVYGTEADADSNGNLVIRLTPRQMLAIRGASIRAEAV